MIVWLCGVCQGYGGSWATVALAAHPGGFLRHGTVAPAAGDFERFGARAGDVFRGSVHELRVRMGDDAWVDARLRPRVTWPRRALGGLGPGQLVPGLAQYWHPVLLAAEIEGEACIGGRRLRLEGARAYVEKNWGPGFAGRWWWGEADAFPDPDVGVAFAGGRLPMLGVSAAPTAVVVRLGERVLRLVPPLARAQARVDAQSWHVQVRSPRYRLELEGETAGETRAPAARPRRVGATCRDALSAGAGGPAPPARRSGTAHAHRRGLAARRPRARGAVSRARLPSARRAAAVSASAPTRRSNGPTTFQSTPQAKRCGAVDRLHASLRGQLRPAIGARCGPVREGHAHGAGLVPIAKGRRVGERGVVAGQGPDAPAEP